MAFCLPRAVHAAPLREVVYHYTVLYQQNGEQHYGGIGGYGSGVTANIGSGSRTGTVTFDVLDVAKDGGLVIAAHEHIYEEPRDSAVVTCAVYGDGRYTCGSLVPSDVESVMLMLLGRNFFDPTRLDTRGHWLRDLTFNDAHEVTDFSAQLPVTPIEVIHAKTTITGPNATLHDIREDETLTYDTGMSIPTQVHDDALQDSRGSDYLRTTMDVKLVSDSFAKKP